MLGLAVRGNPYAFDQLTSDTLALRQGAVAGWFVDLMWWVSVLTSGWRKFALAAVAGLALAGWRWRALLPAAAVALAGTIAELSKPWFGRLRPALEQLDPIASAAYPSGHSANAAALAMALVLMATGRQRGPMTTLAIALAGATGLSRVMLAVHWPSDVIGGWAIGIASALLLGAWWDRYASREGLQ